MQLQSPQAQSWRTRVKPRIYDEIDAILNTIHDCRIYQQQQLFPSDLVLATTTGGSLGARALDLLRRRSEQVMQ
jgi:hypothetical protein